MILLVIAFPLPWKPPFKLHLQRDAEEPADSDDHGEHGNVLEARLDGDGPNDVGGNQDFQSEQNGSADVLAKLAVGIGPWPERART